MAADALRILLRIQLVVVFVTAHIVHARSAELNLRLDRDSNSNEISLTCRHSDTTSIVMNPIFLLNSTDLASQVSVRTITADANPIQFTITQDLEGNYECLSGQERSNILQLVAYPQEDPNTQLYYAGEVGVPLQIDCGFRPGKLRSYYDYEWAVETMNGLIIMRQSDSRFQLNPDDFSLTIVSLDFNYAGTYHCNVDVTIRPPSSTVSVPAVPRSVIAYRSSRIQTRPESQIEILSANEEKSSEFICAATGDPRPTIQWKHNGEHVNMDADDGRFRITTEMNQDNVTVTSRLNVTRLLPTDSGRIECVTWNTVNSGGRQLNFNASSAANLSVLSDSFGRDVVITTEGNLLLIVILPAVIPEPLGLIVRYTGESGLSRDRLVPDTFEGQEEITVEILGTDVPFQNERFKVQVALQVNRLTTLFVPSTAEGSDSYDLSEPTTPTTDGNTTDQPGGGLSDDVIIVIIAAVFGGVIIVVLIIGPLFIYIGCYWRHRRRKQMHLHEMDNEFIRRPDVSKEEAREVMREARVRPDAGEGETSDTESDNKSETSGGDQSPVVHRVTRNPLLDQTNSSQEPPLLDQTNSSQEPPLLDQANSPQEPPPDYESATSTKDHDEQHSCTEAAQPVSPTEAPSTTSSRSSMTQPTTERSPKIQQDVDVANPNGEITVPGTVPTPNANEE